MDPRSKNTQHIQLREFKLEWMVNDAITVLVGKRRSGKSWLMREIMYTLAKRGFPYGKIYSGTEHCNPFFRNFFPALFIDNEFTDDDLREILESQRKKVRKHAKKMGISDGRCLGNALMCAFDDMMSDDDIWKKSKHFKKIFIEGRRPRKASCHSQAGSAFGTTICGPVNQVQLLVT